MEHFLQPGRLAKTGLDAAGPIFLQLDDMMGFPEVFANLDAILVLFLAWLVVILCFFVLAVQLFITLIEFKLTTLAGFVLVPFALWNKTSFLAEKVLGNVVSSGIKVLVLAVIVGIGSGLFSQFQVHPDEPSIDHALVVMLASLALLALGIYGPGIATGLVSGAPQLGAGAMAGAAVGAVGTGVAIGAAATGVGGAVAAGARMAPAAAKLAGAGARAATSAAGSAKSAFQAGSAAAGGGAKGAAAGLGNVAKTGRAGGRSPCRIGCCRCRAEGGRFLPCRMERCRGRRFRLRAGQHRRSRRQRRQLAEAGTTRLGQADAPPPADHPCRNHRRPHAARWRRRRLRARSEPARFRYPDPKENPMRFKRPQVRYAVRRSLPPRIKPPPAWDERIGSARVQAKNWRFMAFGCLLLALLMAGGLVWRSAQSIVTPYVIEVDKSGQVRAVGEAATPYKPADAQIAYHLAHFIMLVRSLSIDPIVVRQNWLDAYDYTTDKGAAVLNDYASKSDPFARVGKSR